MKVRLALSAVVLGLGVELSHAQGSASCPELIRIRDTVIAQRIGKIERTLAASREARALFDSLLADLRSAELQRDAAHATSRLLHKIEIAGGAAEVLLGMIAPQGPVVAAMVRNASTSTVVGHALVDFGKRAVSNTQNAYTILESSNDVDVYFAFWSFVPAVSSWTALAKSAIDMARMETVARLDGSLLASRTDFVKRQLQAAEARLEALHRQGGVAKAIKDEIDRLCSRTNIKASRPRDPAVEEVSRVIGTEAGSPLPRTSMDCRVLDTAEGSVVAADQPERYTALLRKCGFGLENVSDPDSTSVRPSMCIPGCLTKKAPLRPRPVNGDCPLLPGERCPAQGRLP